MAEERLEKRSIKLTEPARIGGSRYEEGDSVEVYGFEADRFVAEGWAEEGKKSRSSRQSETSSE